MNILLLLPLSPNASREFAPEQRRQQIPVFLSHNPLEVLTTVQRESKSNDNHVPSPGRGIGFIRSTNAVASSSQSSTLHSNITEDLSLQHLLTLS